MAARSPPSATECGGIREGVYRKGKIISSVQTPSKTSSLSLVLRGYTTFQSHTCNWDFSSNPSSPLFYQLLFLGFSIDKGSRGTLIHCESEMTQDIRRDTQFSNTREIVVLPQHSTKHSSERRYRRIEICKRLQISTPLDG